MANMFESELYEKNEYIIICKKKKEMVAKWKWMWNQIQCSRVYLPKSSPNARRWLN